MFKTKKINNLWLFLFAADIAAIVAAYYTTLLIRFHSVWGARVFTFINRSLGVRETGHLGEMLEEFYVISAPRIMFFVCITVCMIYALRYLYSGRRFIRKRADSWNIVVANVIALFLFYTYFYFRRNVFHPRSLFVTLMVANTLFCILFRQGLDRARAFLIRRFGIGECRALLVGAGSGCDYLEGYLNAAHPHGIRIVERIRNCSDDFTMTEGTIETKVAETEAELVIVAADDLSVAEIMGVLEIGDRLGVPMKILSSRLDVLVVRARLPVDTIHGVSLVHFDASDDSGMVEAAKGVVSRLAASTLLILTLPLTLLIAVIIKVTSRGPILFAQERIGVNRKSFTMYKFRTMHDQADEILAQVEELNDAGDVMFKMKRDPRVTVVGRFLRRFSLDELPQLMNVVRGDMRIVGPRPLPRRDFENYYEEWHYGRHAGMPGLTCLWQVSGRSDLSFYDMCILDVYYLRNQSWVMDLKIILKTFWVVLFAKGAY